MIFNLPVSYNYLIWNSLCTWWFVLSVSQSFHSLWNIKITGIGLNQLRIEPKSFSSSYFSWKKNKHNIRISLFLKMLVILLGCRWRTIIVSFKAWTACLNPPISGNNNSCSQSRLLPTETRLWKINVHFCWILGVTRAAYRIVKILREIIIEQTRKSKAVAEPEELKLLILHLGPIHSVMSLVAFLTF